MADTVYLKEVGLGTKQTDCSRSRSLVSNPNNSLPARHTTARPWLKAIPSDISQVRKLEACSDDHIRVHRSLRTPHLHDRSLPSLG